MTLRLTCTVYGWRDVDELTFGEQERAPRPEQDGLSAEEHFRWTQFRQLPGGVDTGPLEEWWYHGRGAVPGSARRGIRSRTAR
ncbi:MAG: sarcosine oxidase subunit delta [Gemmatimonadetes bacterium]|nr:sarcosine oxidase subunit delta [Gemmatimonadota bacterium]MYE93044.1 sarcosine oxidase subunit delta [Gemmatimonadota bacterium]MYJ10212.1 sarcosine oxidase subunit delta [Gemmatimonadota bacterium]